MQTFKSMLDGEEAVDRPDLRVGFDELNTLMGFDQIEANGQALSDPGQRKQWTHRVTPGPVP